MLSRQKLQLAAFTLVLLTILTRLPSLLHPQPIDDEAVYSVVANEIVDGGRPYVDAVERKPPLLFWTYAGVFEAAGKSNWKALHIVAVVWTLGTMAGLYAIGRQLFHSSTGLIAALLYSVFQPWATWKNLAFNGEVLMNFPLVWAWALAFRQSSSQLRADLFLAGALLCAAFLLKQPGAIAAVPLGIYLLLPSYRASRGLSPTASFTQAGMLLVGFLGALGVVAMLLRKQGILADAYYWSVTNHTIPHVFWNRGLRETLKFSGECLPLLIGAALACCGRESKIWRDKRAEWTALLGWLAASAIGTAASFRFYPHYYIQLIPPLALLTAPHLARMWTRSGDSRPWLLRPAVTGVWLALTVIAFSLAHWMGLASQRTSSGAGRYLLEHSSPEDRIFVWGHSPRIYLDAQRRPACRYILTFPLTGYVFGGPLPGVDTSKWIMPGAWATLEADFAQHPPRYIVDAQSDPGALYPVRDFPVLAGLLAERYEAVTHAAEGVIYRMR